jgi:RimJ/RimL family protein N-acetyltransferase
MQIPVLETQRLILRGHEPSDFADYFAMWSDPDVTRFIGGKPLNEEEAWAKFMRAFGHWDVVGYGFWSVHEKAGGARVGETGILNVKRTIVPSLEGMPETGWAFAKRAHGKGYATEAVKAIHQWADKHFGKLRMCCIIAPENTASLRVAEKNGYREAARTTYHDDPTVILHRDP